MWPSRLYLKDEEDTENPIGFLHLFKDINVLIVSGAILVSTTAMALLEPCLPIWLMDTIHPQKWQIGTVFLPDSVGYLIGTNFFAVPALKYGRYKVAMVALFLVGLGCFLVSLFKADFPHKKLIFFFSDSFGYYYVGFSPTPWFFRTRYRCGRFFTDASIGSFGRRRK